MISRREFLREMMVQGASVASAALLYDAIRRALPREALAKGRLLPPIEAEYYSKEQGGAVTCGLCPRRETLAEGESGFCKSRKNIGGKLMTYASGQPCVINVDPVGKNPLGHVLPESSVFCIAHAGCNMFCKYCQNWPFSQKSPMETDNLEFREADAFQLAEAKKIPALTFTYTEGSSHIEFNKRLAHSAHRQGFRAFLCTNGYVRKEPLVDFLEAIDAVTVTIKGFTNAFYKEYTGVRDFKPVLDACKTIKEAGKWIEIATLLVPGVNDGEKEVRDIAAWIAESLGSDTPWHLERFAPQFQLANLPTTPVKTLERAREIGAQKGLKYVYLSNLAPHEGNHTYCPKCRQPVIKRLGFKLLSNSLRDGRCPHCRTKIPGIWS